MIKGVVLILVKRLTKNSEEGKILDYLFREDSNE